MAELIDIQVPGVLLATASSSLWAVYDFISTEEYLPLCMELPYLHHPTIKVYGKEVHQRRDILFVSDTSKGYRYSGQLMPSVPFGNMEWLKEIMNLVNTTLSTSFNGILINRYTDGADSIGPHSDDERGLSNGIVAAISLGGERTFRVRDKSTGNIVLDTPTVTGSLMVMDGAFQREFKHEIPPTKKVTPPRISLTFREHRD
jgi:alkylated DNA repair dioxygenase AlkB